MTTMATVKELLKKTTSADKDYRYMALNDLHGMLVSATFRFDDRMQADVVRRLVLCLDDANHEVQNMAVQCLAPLVGKVAGSQVQNIIDPLTKYVLTGDEKQRDIAAIGLKSVIGNIAPGDGFASVFGKSLVEKLSKALKPDLDDTVMLEILDILTDLLTRFAGSLASQHQSTLERLVPLLSHERPAVRKRTIQTLASALPFAPDTIYSWVVNHVADKLAASPDGSTGRTMVLCLASASRTGGKRMAPFLERVVPLVMASAAVEEDDELREAAVQCLEAFAVSCPDLFAPHLSEVVKMCLEYIAYDPNYNYGGGDSDDDMDFGSDSDDDLDYDDDDDDITWKVRRSAADFLTAAIKSRPALLAEFYTNVMPVLIEQCKEREENVRVQVLSTISAIAEQTRAPGAILGAGIDAAVTGCVPAITGHAKELLKNKSVKTRQAVVALLKDLTAAKPGIMAGEIGALAEGLAFSLSDKASTSNVKIDTLELIHALIQNNPAASFTSSIVVYTTAVIGAVGDSFYKITSEALLVCTAFISVMRPDPETPLDSDFSAPLQQVFDCVFAKLSAIDVDQEVKERSITCVGTAIAVAGDVLAAGVTAALPVLLARLQNEITSVVTTKTLAVIAASPLKIDLNTILSESVTALASFLRKKSRVLLVASLNSLTTLAQTYGAAIAAESLSAILKEVPTLIDAADLHCSQLAMTTVTAIITARPDLVPQLAEHQVLEVVLTLALSQMLQGGTRTALLNLLACVAAAKNAAVTADSILESFTSPIYAEEVGGGGGGAGMAVDGGPQRPQRSFSDADSYVLPKQVHNTLAMCVATIGKAGGMDMVALATKFADDAAKDDVSESVKLLGLRTLGEIGKSADLGGSASTLPTIYAAFNSEKDGVKSAASFALGNVTGGNLAAYLPQLVTEVKAQKDKQYLLLNALKELVVSKSSTEAGTASLQPFVEGIWSLLFEFSESPEEGTRNVVGECLGKLTLVHPAQLLPALDKHLASESPFGRGTAITAFKFTLSDQRAANDAVLQTFMPKFFAAISDDDVDVRRMSLGAFNSAAHNKPALVRELLATVLPAVYKQTEKNMDLVRVVEMGPFKQQFDDGLDARKSAFECMHTVLENLGGSFSIQEFIGHLVVGLTDTSHDIKMLCYLMTVRIANEYPAVLLEAAGGVVAALNKALDEKEKKNDIPQEKEKRISRRKSVVRVLNALVLAPGNDAVESITTLLSRVRADADLKLELDENKDDADAMEVSSGGGAAY